LAKASRADRVFRGLVTAAAVAVLAVLALVAVFLVVKAWPALRSAGFDILTE
jgi:phosphate transport system permease protein